jgi:hypothetical protein
MLHRMLLALVVVAFVVPQPSWARGYYHRRGYGRTPYGSASSGLGALIRAEGAYNQMTAQAMLTLEHAKTAALDNKLKAAQTYYQLHRLNETERAEAERKRLATFVHVDPPKAPRPTASQLDPVSGQITWQKLLQDDGYKAERQRLETLFGLRALDPTQTDSVAIEHTADALRDKLDARINEYPTPDFFAARHLIEALAVEALAAEAHAP